MNKSVRLNSRQQFSWRRRVENGCPREQTKLEVVLFLTHCGLREMIDSSLCSGGRRGGKWSKGHTFQDGRVSRVGRALACP